LISASPLLSSRARRCLIVAALLWFVAALLALAPAAAAVRLLRWGAPQLELAAVDGSFWHGSAGQAFLNLGNQRVALGRLEWQLNGWSLLWLHPSAKISAEWGDQILDARLRVGPFGDVNVRELRAVMPVELVKIWAPVPARGALGVNIDAVDFNRQSLQSLRGKIDWRRAQWQWGDRWLMLGDYQFDMQTHDGVLDGKIAGGSDLAATGAFTAHLEKRTYEINAQLSASRGLPQEFRDSLVFLLRAQPQNPNAGAGEPVVLKLQRGGTW
jgi:hypothetical protein